MATSGVEEINSSTPEAEVGGRIEPNRKDQPLCTPCDSDGRKLGAVGYCVNCKEYLCENCYTHHRLPTLMRKHVLLDQTRMPRTAGNYCPDHDYRPVEYHCPTHALLGCHVCFLQHQKTCKEIKFIPDVAKDLPSSEEFKVFAAKLKNVGTKTTDLIQDVKRSLESVDQLAADEIAAIKAFKLEVLEAIDRLEKGLINKVEATKQGDTTKLKDILTKYASLQDTSLSMSTEFEVLQNRQQSVDLYVAMVKNKGKLASLECELGEAEGESFIRQTKFHRNDELVEELKCPFVLGKIVETGSISTDKCVADINVKTANDTSECCIRGSAMMPDAKLVIADTNNKSVKLVDTRQRKVVSEVKLTNRPWSVARVTDKSVAVTIPDDKKITFVRIDPTLGVDREIAVKDKCHGLAYCDGKLIATCVKTPYKVQVLDIQGTLLLEIQTDVNGKSLFYSPYAAAVNPDQGLVYVSNYGDHNVACLKLDGTVVATYKDSELQYPQQAAVTSSGMVFVLAYSSKNVHMLTADCKKVKVLLSSSDGIEVPETLSYDDARRRLYVSSRDKLKVYQVSYSTL